MFDKNLNSMPGLIPEILFCKLPLQFLKAMQRYIVSIIETFTATAQFFFFYFISLPLKCCENRQDPMCLDDKRDTLQSLYSLIFLPLFGQAFLSGFPECSSLVSVAATIH